MTEKYLICMQHRNALGRVVQKVNPVLFDTIEDAEAIMPEVARVERGMTWIVSVPIPLFNPPLKVVKAD
jgi:hypothetical protein